MIHFHTSFIHYLGAGDADIMFYEACCAAWRTDTVKLACHIQQYHIYYRGTCRSYVDEGRLDADFHTFDGLQEVVNYSFTVNQTGFGGGRVLSTGPVYARTFTTGNQLIL